MTTAQIHEEEPLSVDEIDLALGLVIELENAGRIEEARAVYKLARAQAIKNDEAYDERDLPPDAIDALRRGEGDLLAGRVIPHDVVVQGREAVAQYKRRRAAGDIPPEVAADIAAAQRQLPAERAARNSV